MDHYSLLLEPTFWLTSLGLTHTSNLATKYVVFFVGSDGDGTVAVPTPNMVACLHSNCCMLELALLPLANLKYYLQKEKI